MTEENELNLGDIEQLKKRIKELKEQGKWEEVERIQRQILEIEPSNVRALVDLVIIAKQKGDWEEVRRIQRKKAEIEPDDTRAISDLVLAAKNLNDWAEVEKLQKQRLEIDSHNIIAMCDLKNIAQKKGDWAQAENLLTRMLEIDPNNSLAKKDLKRVRKKLDKKEKKEMTEEEISVKNQTAGGKKGIADIRVKLYAGEIDISQIPEIVEQYSCSTQGTILIAEVYTYFGRQSLALQALKKYQKEHSQDMTPVEQKGIKGAMEIARGKQRIHDAKKWGTSYGDGNETR